MHLGKNLFERESEKRRLGLIENQGFCGRSSYIWMPSDQGGRKKLGQRVPSDLRYEHKP